MSVDSTLQLIYLFGHVEMASISGVVGDWIQTWTEPPANTWLAGFVNNPAKLLRKSGPRSWYVCA